MKPSIKIALGVFTALAVMAFIVLWDQVFKNKLDSVNVVVVKAGTTIQPSEIIDKSMLAVERRSKKDLIANVVYPDQINQIIGKDSGELMIGNSMVSSKMIDWDSLVPNPKLHQAIRPLPKDWIYAVPGSLRRKDTITIYAISDSAIQSLKMADSNQTSNSGLVVTLPKNNQSSNNGSVVKLLSGIRVEYAKDSSNDEVIGKTVQDPNSSPNNTRLDASGTVSELELLLTQDQFNTISNAVLNNHCELYITYQ